MSEKINLIPANQLPVTGASDVNVLCLENGAIKQKPAKQIAAETINSISNANLPEAEGEEVNVLCVENGALKQKPIVGIGGHYIMLIKDDEYNPTVIASDGIYEVLDKFLINNMPVHIDLVQRRLLDDRRVRYELSFVTAIYRDGEDTICVDDYYGTVYVINKDGNHTYYS